MGLGPPLKLHRAVPSVALLGGVSLYVFVLKFFNDSPPVAHDEHTALGMCAIATFFVRLPRPRGAPAACDCAWPPSAACRRRPCPRLCFARTDDLTSAAQNVLVVNYHLTTPPHPKFRLIRKRQICLKTHVAAGVLEIATAVSGLVSFYAFGQSPSKHALYAAPAGVIHALTGLYQTQLVFGCQLVMKPAYYWCGVMHLAAAIATLVRPESHHHLLQQYLILCIFTWCRVFIPLLMAVNFGTGALYSLSISLAGARPCRVPLPAFAAGRLTDWLTPARAGITIFPYVLGAGGPSFFFLFIAVAAFLWAWSADIEFDSPEWAEITTEHVRNQLFDPAAMSSWKGLPPGATKEQSDAAAQRAFDALDNDGSGSLDRAEVMDLLARVKVHSTVRNAIKESLNKFGDEIDFKTFLRCVWNIGERSHPTARGGAASALAGRDLLKLTPKEKARAVFDSIDLDGSGKIEPFELNELLVSWGCPADEIQHYLSTFDADGDGEIDFEDEFYPSMKAIWTFGFDHVLLPKLLEEQSDKGHATVSALLDSREAVAAKRASITSSLTSRLTARLTKGYGALSPASS